MPDRTNKTANTEDFRGHHVSPIDHRFDAAGLESDNQRTRTRIHQAEVESPAEWETRSDTRWLGGGLDDSFPKRLGSFQIIEEIQSGGMGRVLKGHHLQLNRVAAIKIMLADLDPRSRRRFLAEAEALARLDHPNIVPIYEIGEEGGLPFFAMRFVHGGTLSQAAGRLRQNLPDLVRVMAKVARAVDFAHQQGILHRDLKPSNVLMAECDEPLVADFGLAKFQSTDSGLTMTGTLIGTRSYMSPEATRADTHRIGQATDIWSLGVMLYELVSGRLPFTAGEMDELFRQIRVQEPPMLQSAAGHPLPELDRIIRRCLMKSPEARYPTASALADDLESWLSGLSTEMSASAPRTLRQRLRPVVLSSLAILFMVAGLAAIFSQQTVPVEKPRVLLGPTAEGFTSKNYSVITPKDLTMSRDNSGRLTLESADAGILQLGEMEYPTGLRLKACVRPLSTPGLISYAGVYVHGRQTMGPQGPILHMVALGVDSLASGEPHPVDEGGAYLMVARWRPDMPDKPLTPPLFSAMKISAPATDGSLAKFKDSPARDAFLQVDLFPDGSVGPLINHSLQMKKVQFGQLKQSMAMITRHDAQPRIDPPLGSGVGLFVKNCKAAFWNVTVEPLPAAATPHP